MNANDYQEQAARTLLDKPTVEPPRFQMAVVWQLIEIARQFGEFTEYVKKTVFHLHPLDNEKWYVLKEKLDLSCDTFWSRVNDKNHDLSQLSLSDEQKMLVWCLLGFLGEVCEIAALIENAVFIEHGMPDKDKLLKELGDADWYSAGICTKAGIKKSDVLSANIAKLLARFPNGFNSEDSQKRVDMDYTENDE